MSNKDLETLKELSEALGEPVSAAVEAVRIDDPVSAIEGSLVSFVKNSFSRVSENHLFEKAINAQIMDRITEANMAQLIDLQRNIQMANNDSGTRLIVPVLAASQKQREAEGGIVGGPADEAVYKKAPKDVLQGLTALNQLLSVATKIATERNVTPVHVDAAPVTPEPSSSDSEPKT